MTESRPTLDAMGLANFNIGQTLLETIHRCKLNSNVIGACDRSCSSWMQGMQGVPPSWPLSRSAMKLPCCCSWHAGWPRLGKAPRLTSKVGAGCLRLELIKQGWVMAVAGSKHPTTLVGLE